VKDRILSRDARLDFTFPTSSNAECNVRSRATWRSCVEVHAGSVACQEWKASTRGRERPPQPQPHHRERRDRASEQRSTYRAARRRARPLHVGRARRRRRRRRRRGAAARREGGAAAGRRAHGALCAEERRAGVAAARYRAGVVAARERVARGDVLAVARRVSR